MEARVIQEFPLPKPISIYIIPVSATGRRISQPSHEPQLQTPDMSLRLNQSMNSPPGMPTGSQSSR